MRSPRAPWRRRKRRTRPSETTSSRTTAAVRFVQPSTTMWFVSETGVCPSSRVSMVWLSHCVSVATSAPTKTTKPNTVRKVETTRTSVPWSSPR